MLKFYSRAPGYVNAWKRMGFTDDDISGLSDRLVDAVVAWGTADQIEARLQEHADAGATHVCIHPLDPVTGQAPPTTQHLKRSPRAERRHSLAAGGSRRQ